MSKHSSRAFAAGNGNSAAPKPDLLAPAGNWDCARAAVANGADAIYFGLPAFNARMRADNFTMEDLPKLVKYVHDRGVRAHVALNTLVFTSELEEAASMLERLEAAGVDAVIVQDIGVAMLAREIAPSVDLHGSTQMTVTSPEAAGAVSKLGLKQVILARELSLEEVSRCAASIEVPVEVFVHGALCVAYSGQCLTSESLGQRSANRGECAQDCRQPYDLIVDGRRFDLGDRRHLLSPQDLAAQHEIPGLIRAGVRTLKIEGRMKAPEYVAAVTQVYRKAIDACFGEAPALDDGDDYKLEMTFSRGLYSGWLRGDQHQELVHARFGKKRGPFVGRIREAGKDFVDLEASPPDFLRAGDGIVFDTGGDTDHEQGGRVYELRGTRLFFEYDKIDHGKLRPGVRVWKTDDPRLNRELRKTFRSDSPLRRRTIALRLRGGPGEALRVEARLEVSGEENDEALDTIGRASSEAPLQVARTRPLTVEVIREQFGRLGDSAYELGELEMELDGELMLPLSELNRCRRRLVDDLDRKLELAERRRARAPRRSGIEILRERLADVAAEASTAEASIVEGDEPPELVVLCRSVEQLEAALDCGMKRVYADFEDIRRYADAVAAVRARGDAEIFLATPRIQKPGEAGFFPSMARHGADGILARNLGAIDYFSSPGTHGDGDDGPVRLIGDYSLNVANPLTASFFKERGVERMTASYDLNAEQLVDLLEATPRGWFEVTLHQHMPMFHMAHCVFAAFLSDGKDHTDCGHPCDRHRVEVRDHLGVAHPVKADVGCRNTVFNARAQSAARFQKAFAEAGVVAFRVELLDEDALQTRRTLESYRGLIDGRVELKELLETLRVHDRLGVTEGTLRVLN